jgi:hypothetical protein
VDREGHAGALTEARNQRVEALRRNRTATLRAEHVGAGRLLALQPTKRPQLVALNWMDARRPALASPHMQPPGVERADASDHTAGTPAHPLTYDAAACTDHRHDNGATGDKLQIERARIQPHHAQPRKAQVEVKYRAHRLLKHLLADQFAHVERDRPMVFDSARSAPANSGHHSRTTAMPAGIRFRFVDDDAH